MAMYALDLLNIALRLARHEGAYEDVAVKFVEHFLRIAASVNASGMWDDNDAYFYDILHLTTGEDVPLKVRSLVGLIPVIASLVVDDSDVVTLPFFRDRLTWFIANNPEFADSVHHQRGKRTNAELLALVSPERLRRILPSVFDEAAMLSDHGIRSISAFHREHPFTVEVNGSRASVDYEPAESTTGLFGGNSNWRGPVWFPLNVLLIEALRAYDSHSRDQITVELPTGSGHAVNLDQAADALSDRLISLFRKGAKGVRPSDARYPLLSTDPRWRDNLLFYEYFDGDTGEGLGASHQSGWTALVAHLILRKRVPRRKTGASAAAAEHRPT